MNSIIQKLLIACCFLITTFAYSQSYTFHNFYQDFNSGRGISVSKGGKVYLTKTNNNIIAVLTQSGDSFGQYTTFGTGNSGISNDELNAPWGITVTDDDKIYVADFGNHRIQVLTQTGTSIGFFASFGSFGTSNTEFNSPINIHVSNNKIYVADFNNNRIQVLTQSGNNIGFYATYGSSGSTITGLVKPVGVFEKNNKIYVTDAGSRVQLLTQSGTNIGFLSSFGSLDGGGNPNNILKSPADIKISNDNKIYIVDNGNSNIKILSLVGNNLTYIDSFGEYGTSDFNFANPSFMSIDDNDNFYINNTFLGGISIWKYCIPTEIVVQPFNKTVCKGSVATFEVSATGSNVSYLWTNNQTTPIMTTTVSGTYQVSVSKCGIVTSSDAILTQQPLTTIVSSLESKTICGGTFTTLNTQATGTGTITYKWSHNSNIITSSISTSLAGIYLVTASGSCGKAITSATVTSIICPTDVEIISVLVSKSLNNTINPILVSISGIGFTNLSSITIGGVKLINITQIGNIIKGTIPANSNVLNYLDPIFWIENPNYSATSLSGISIIDLNLTDLNETKKMNTDVILVFPNPSLNGEFMVKNGGLTIIYDFLGNEITKSEEQTFKILTKGIFFAKITNKTSSKFIKLIVE